MSEEAEEFKLDELPRGVDLESFGLPDVPPADSDAVPDWEECLVSNPPTDKEYLTIYGELTASRVKVAAVESSLVVLDADLMRLKGEESDKLASLDKMHSNLMAIDEKLALLTFETEKVVDRYRAARASVDKWRDAEKKLAVELEESKSRFQTMHGKYVRAARVEKKTEVQLSAKSRELGDLECTLLALEGRKGRMASEVLQAASELRHRDIATQTRMTMGEVSKLTTVSADLAAQTKRTEKLMEVVSELMSKAPRDSR